MECRVENKARKLSLLTLVAVVALASGCGDGLFSGGGAILGSNLSRELSASMGGAEVDVLEYASCDALGIGEEGRECKGFSEGQVEVYVQGQSLIFDFSNVAVGATPDSGSFQGFVVSAPSHSKLPPILEAAVDAAMSSLGAEDLEVDFDDKNVAVSFQGFAYDHDTFVKIDLVFDEP